MFPYIAYVVLFYIWSTKMLDSFTDATAIASPFKGLTWVIFCFSIYFLLIEFIQFVGHTTSYIKGFFYQVNDILCPLIIGIDCVRVLCISDATY